MKNRDLRNHNVISFFSDKKYIKGPNDSKQGDEASFRDEGF